MTTVTQWFEIDKDGNPARKGWYQVLFAGCEGNYLFLRYWDGLNWFVTKNTFRSVFGQQPTENEKWRGLAAKP